ncbi:MAG: hypothetical protein EA417_19450 [Gammaproteobacteria bacterium]|nr:MAG: hypothetical protein EA417_19450 [Gammaproteobacteria bacterium]
MGIDCYVRRAAAVATGRDAAGNPDRPTPDDLTPAAGPPSPAAETLAQRPVTTVRQLLEAAPGCPAPVPESAAAPAAAPQSDAAQTVVPRFRLVVLRLAGSVLLVDEGLLSPGEVRGEQLLLLGDLLRAGRLLVQGSAEGEVEKQVFYWPQVDDPALDQAVPRAREALAFHIRSRLEDGPGPVLWVGAEDAPDHSGSTMARLGIADLSVCAVRFDPDLLDLTLPGSVRVAAWKTLGTLGAAS